MRSESPLHGSGSAAIPLVVAFLAAALVVAWRASPDAQPRTTMSGVYSAAQASRGEETYMAICVACHPAGTYSTDVFKATWNGRPLSDLFGLISETMPKNDPGSLSPQEYAQVLTYILKVNGIPAGKTALPTSAEEMKRIKIEMPGVRAEKK